MNKLEAISELVNTTSLSISKATKLVNERIAMKVKEINRKNIEIELKKIDKILGGIENE